MTQPVIRLLSAVESSTLHVSAAHIMQQPRLQPHNTLTIHNRRLAGVHILETRHGWAELLMPFLESHFVWTRGAKAHR